MLKKGIFITLAVLLLLPLAACAKTGSSTEFGNQPGNKAFDFSLQDMNGNTVTLSGLAGRPVMLNFWETT